MLDLGVFVHPPAEIAAHQRAHRILVQTERAGILKGDWIALLGQRHTEIPEDIDLVAHLAVFLGRDTERAEHARISRIAPKVLTERLYRGPGTVIGTTQLRNSIGQCADVLDRCAGALRRPIQAIETPRDLLDAFDHDPRHAFNGIGQELSLNDGAAHGFFELPLGIAVDGIAEAD
ncbi:hypothetical protein G6L15_08615 [Agrobacterium rhizogenes]|uniref:hypothetical protein n=1 Tax=Rhizobium rhizogenes TaxID=359 RepID=UPI0015727450|nr:hypothetical protein [Rhizobium rhizogenes]NTG86207.1 hypothetical protein [Rhizobium rhizogenes]